MMTNYSQILGQKLNHPEDLQSIDNELYNGMVKWVLENSVEDMEMPFSINCTNPWNDSLVEEVNLSKTEDSLNDKNKVWTLRPYYVCIDIYLITTCILP